MDIPCEIWEKIAFYDRGVFNILVRSIPKLGRKTLNSTFQDCIIERFNLYQYDKGGSGYITINEKYHSIYDKPAIIWKTGAKMCVEMENYIGIMINRTELNHGI